MMTGEPERITEFDVSGQPYLSKPFTPGLFIQRVRDGRARHCPASNALAEKKPRPKPGQAKPWPPTRAKAQGDSRSYHHILNAALTARQTRDDVF
jgi:hypothetical protein